jgi:tRNA 2-thiouridine synthesizing protein A
MTGLIYVQSTRRVMTIVGQANLVVDTRGALCPIPILRTSQAIKQIKVGDVLEVLATDPGSKPDITAWTRMTGNELISATEDNAPETVYRFLIRRVK